MPLLASVLNRAAVILALNRAGDHEANERFAQALEANGQAIMHVSKTIYVPVATGQLMNTGNVKKPVKRGNDWFVEMMYGESIAYALNVHETNRNYGGGRMWKYLETPAKQWNHQSFMATAYRGLPGASVERGAM